MPVTAELAEPSMAILPAVTLIALALPELKESEKITPRWEIDSDPVAETSMLPAFPDDEVEDEMRPPLMIVTFPVAETPMLPALPVPPGCARVAIPADELPCASIVILPAPTLMDPELFADGALERTKPPLRIARSPDTAGRTPLTPISRGPGPTAAIL